MRKTKLAALFAVFALLLAACGPSEAEMTPTINPNDIRTQAVSTFASGLTQTATLRPTATPTLTPLATITLPALTTPLATLPVGTGTVTTGTGGTLCTKLVYVADVTVPDNTQMTPGQSFTKTWRVQNSGSCEWKAGFRFSLISGDPMGAQAFTLPQSVTAGATYEISVPMVAPNRTGTIRGDWRMSDDKGAFFGDAVYVQIVVGGAAATNTTGAATNTTSAATSTATPTITPTP
ncbi:MAG: NBR1-Ig-like domain-containing protein [Chloroflexota bacterium]